MRGLVPLGWLAGTLALTLVLSALGRTVIGQAQFFSQQSASLAIVLTGFLGAIVLFFIAIARLMQRIAGWHAGGNVAQANAALWVLSVTAVVVVLPFLLAIGLPQMISK